MKRRDGQMSKSPLNYYLICIWYVYWFPALGNVSGDPRSPSNANLVLLLHLLQRAPRTHVEQLRYKTSASKTKEIVELFLWYKKKVNKFERECSSLSELPIETRCNRIFRFYFSPFSQLLSIALALFMSIGISCESIEVLFSSNDYYYPSDGNTTTSKLKSCVFDS